MFKNRLNRANRSERGDLNQDCRGVVKKDIAVESLRKISFFSGSIFPSVGGGGVC